MTVPIQTPYVEYTGNNTATVFPLTFFAEQGTLTVLVNDQAANNWSLVNQDVVFQVAPAVNAKIKISRKTPLEREVDYQTHDNSFRPVPVNKELDRLWRAMQEVNHGLDVETQQRILADIEIDQASRLRDDELRAYIEALVGQWTGNIAGLPAGYVINQRLPGVKLTRTQQQKNNDLVNPKDFGAIADGTLHTAFEWTQGSNPVFSDIYAIRAVFPFVLTLDESIDYIALQHAINTTTGTVFVPEGMVLNREIVIRNKITLTGAGAGDCHVPHRFSTRQTSDLTFVGDGSICRTRRTRRKYRGVDTDPQDDPLSAGLNIQAAGVRIENMRIHCAGTNWDVGIFNGCRLSVEIDRVAVTGVDQNALPHNYLTGWQIACIYSSSADSPDLEPFRDWRGESLPAVAVSGADGFSVTGSITWGGRWGILCLGAEFKSGLSELGHRYMYNIPVDFNDVPQLGDLLLISNNMTVVFTDGNLETEPEDTASMQYIVVPLTTDIPGMVQYIADQAEYKASLVEDGLEAVRSGFALATYIADGARLNVVRRRTGELPITGDDPYYNTFVVTTNADPRIGITNFGVPQTFADPAPYFINDALVTDHRGQLGQSDVVIDDCSIYGMRIPSREFVYGYRRADGNWLAEGWSSGCVWLDDLHKTKFSNCRIDLQGNVFGIRLGSVRVAGVYLQLLLPDGSGRKPPEALELEPYTKYAYPWLTFDRIRTKRVFCQQLAASALSFPEGPANLLTNGCTFGWRGVGDAWLGDNLGNAKVRQISALNYRIDRRANVGASATYEAMVNGGIASYTMRGSTGRASLQYFDGSKNLYLQNATGAVRLLSSQKITMQIGMVGGSTTEVATFDAAGLRPNVSTYNLGTTTLPFDQLYVNKIHNPEFQSLIDNISNLAGGAAGYQTKALLDAVTPSNPNQLAYVLNDTDTTKNGMYGWNGTIWVKSPYDPLGSAITLMNQILPNAGIFANDHGGITVTDAKNQPIIVTTRDGRVYVENLKNFARIDSLGKIFGVADVFDPGIRPLLIVDAKNQPQIFDTPDGRLYLPTLQDVVRPADITDILTIAQNLKPAQIGPYIVTDAKYNGMFISTNDGRLWLPTLQDVVRPADLEELNLSSGYNRFRGTIRLGMSIGQSNTLGSGATKTSLTQPYKNLMMNLPNNQTRYSERDASGVLLYAPTGLIPLVENGVESTLSVTINELTRRILADRLPVNDVVFAGYCTGNGGTRFELLSKGAPIMADNDDPPNALNDFAMNWYECMRLGLADILNFINLTGKVALIDFVNITEGEADTVNRTTKLQYMDLQRGYISDFSEECYAITGKPFTGIVVLNQCCAMRSYVSAATYTQFRLPYVPQAQLEMGLNDSNMVLACPDYPFSRSDYVHFSADTQPLHCAYKARALKAWYDGRKWLPTYIKKCEWFSDHIILTYHVPHGRLQIETSQVAAAINYGFDIWQPAVNAINLETVTGAITSVVVDGVDRIRVNLAADYPAGTLLTYAWGRVDDPLACAGPTIGPRGNIADTHGRTEKFTLPVSLTVYSMHNYAVVQDFTRG